MKPLLLLLPLAGTAAAQSTGGPWTLRTSTTDSGGQTSTGGTWKVTGTLGQPDATAAKSTAGTWAAQGGFWPGVVATPGGPVLTITRENATQVRVAYTDAAGYTLERSTDLQNWTFTSQVPSGSSAGSLTWPIANGPRVYFRLKKL